MRDEYDFSNAERGRFHREDANLRLPVYLDDDLSERLGRRARTQGVALAELVNDVLRRELAQTEDER